MEVTQEEERIGPNYMKLVQRFVYLLAQVGSNSNNNNNDNNNNNNNNDINNNKLYYSSLCRLCGKSSKSVWHIVSKCNSNLAQKEYKKHHDRIELRVQQNSE